MIRVNEVKREDVASVIFTVTADLNAEFPAMAARQLGWLDVPLLCTREIDGPGALPRCVRILISWNTTQTQDEITHIYRKEAVKLRPDLSSPPSVDLDELEAWIAQQMADMKAQQDAQRRHARADD